MVGRLPPQPTHANQASLNQLPNANRFPACADPRFIDTDRLASATCAGSVEEVRGWLYFVLGLSDLFSGSGWTQRADGSRGVKEYLMPNRPVEAFDAFSWVELRV